MWWSIGIIFLLSFTFASTTGNTSFTTKCNNGEVIGNAEFCDGKIDCSDGSDETILSCLHIHCPAYSFQCTYGACVNGNALCDGVKDCADGSDEISACNSTNYNPKGNCPPTSFQCKTSGECIKEYVACDGKVDCADGSDETVDLCSSFFCPSFAFRCGYGGCINGNSKCDGVVDCVDASDESPNICNVSSIDTNQVTTMRTTSTTAPREDDVPIQEYGCVIKHIPKMKYYLQSDNKRLHKGDQVDEYDTVVYECSPRFLLVGHNSSLCLKGQWQNEPPKCIKCCSNIPISGLTFKADCEYNGIGIGCFSKISPGTKAKLSCKEGYEKPNRSVHDTLTCSETGEWDYSPFRCKEMCGTEAKHPQTNRIMNNMVPWNVAVYSKSSGPYKYLCSGTIIKAKIVLTAVSCFEDGSNEILLNEEDFMVGAGKAFRDLDANELLSSQFVNISQIYISPEYRGLNLYYQQNIALLVLNNFIEFNSYIKPICIKWHKQNNIQENTLGQISGWGKKNDSPRDLRMFRASSIDFSKCYNHTHTSHLNLITSDKFCVNIQNENLCIGNTGAAFTSWNIEQNVKTFYLYGIASNRLSDSRSCTGNIYTVFTNIQLYREIINDFLQLYKPK